MQTVTAQSFRIGFVFLMLVVVGVWQLDFVRTAIGANPALNMIIFGTFAFGATLVVATLLGFRNEFRALYALMELYDDVANEDRAAAADPLWRFYRCAKVGIVFNKPRVLGQSYQLISEQLHRDGALQISTSTMQTLIAGIEERLSEERALISYVAGILIFLGLIGTFIGLMVTLASVGAILGELDLTAEDPTQTVALLMNNLQTPLGGMATGFSSSLFGLVTSLALSLTIQLLGRAGGRLKAEFSDWVSNAVELHDNAESATAAAAPGASAARLEERRLTLLMRTARHLVQSNQRQSRSLQSLTDEVRALTAAGHATRQSLDEVTGGLGVLHEQNQIVHTSLARSVDLFARLDHGAQIRAEVEELSSVLTKQLSVRDAQREDHLRHIHERLSAIETGSGTASQKADDKDADELALELAADTERLNIRQLKRLLALAARQMPKDKAADDGDISPAPEAAQGGG